MTLGTTPNPCKFRTITPILLIFLDFVKQYMNSIAIAFIFHKMSHVVNNFIILKENELMTLRAYQKLSYHSDNKLINMLRIRYVALLSMIDKAYEASSKSQELSCKSGCSDCCRGLFEITVLDALLMLPAIHDISGRSDSIKEASRQSNLLREANSTFPHSLSETEAHDSFEEPPEFETLPCPLLDSTNTCSIYESRPSICRFQGLALRDPRTHIELQDDCRLFGRNPKPVDFDLETFDLAELDFFKILCSIIPEFNSMNMEMWDIPISSVVLLANDKNQ